MSDPTDVDSPISPDDTVLVFTGGDLMARTAGLLPVAGYVVTADSGLEQAQRLGYDPDLVLGDFDSVAPEALAAVERSGAVVERHPVAKDMTDLELALDAAIARTPRRIVVVGGHGGRLDHFFAGALALTREASGEVEVSAYIGDALLHVVRRRLRVDGSPGVLLSLLAINGPAIGVSTEGLLYPLHAETLEPGSTRGVSNEMTGTAAAITVESGVLLAVLPGASGNHVLAARRSPSIPDQERPCN